MVAAGFDCLIDLASQAIMGLFPVLAALPRIRRWFRLAVDELERFRPHALVLVDYPGFNLRLAARAKRLGIPVLYYVSPQVWAWNRSRIKKIARSVDRLLVILPFEEEAYRGSGLDVRYVGHPSVDHVARSRDAALLRRESYGPGAPRIGVFPGSREHVVRALWPVFKQVIDHVAARRPDATFVVAAASERLASIIRELGLPTAAKTSVAADDSGSVMAWSDACLTTSGTTTIELALWRRPMVLAYQVSALLWIIGRRVVKVPFIGLVNLIAGRRVVPEHVGNKLNPGAIAADLDRLLDDGPDRTAMLGGLDEVVAKLGPPGGYARAAAAIAAFLHERTAAAPAVGED